ncbi:unnamed protein product [Rhizoctonia solani]|uniref:Uncharacterized protein n=1 Tax=Rhizoctonia solani TaxID=456999 RepID=A0A8H3BMU1_9AGAM|nr:unnamed protein product [Rhizoctonia solani]
MAAYYSGPRVRLPSNRSLQLSDVSGPSSPPAARDKDKETYASARDAYTHSHSPVLIFPTAPSSEPASPHPRVARLRHLRVDSTASSSSRAVSTRVRVDSNATSDLSSPIRVGSDFSSSVRVGSDFSSPIRVGSDISLLARLDSDNSIRTRVDSNASSLLASPSLIEVPSPRFSLTSTSGWDLSPTGSAPLTRDRIVRLGSARVIPSWSSGSAEVEMWEWTSEGSSWQGRRGDENETQYEDALSQFHFPTLEESRWACQGGAVEKGGIGLVEMGGLGLGGNGGLGLVERNGQGDGGLVVAHPALGEQQQRTVRLPFRFILETVLGIDPATLSLLERGTHEPESISETAIFGTATDAGITDDEIEAIERSERIVWPSFSLLCVWAGLGMPKWRVGQR